jgi:superfamily II DNA or RNA helicase
MKRYFDRNQKKHLYLTSGGRCERCSGHLGERWDAHHKRRYADGGITEITNALALCERCHILTHRRIGLLKPRGWQDRALERFGEHRELCFLLNATPGAGKTIFSGFCFKQLLEQKMADFAIIIVPTTALKGDREAGFLGDWHKIGVSITTVLKDGSDWPSDFKGGVVTYQQLPNLISTIETWRAKGLRVFAVFDEVHHAAEKNVWGAASERLARCSVKILAMTGTPFRGDGGRISFVSYGLDGKAIADQNYLYKTAVTDRVCRSVEFMTDDGIAEFIRHQEEEKIRLSNAKSDDDVRGATNTIFRADSNWLRSFIERADESLDNYRAIDSDAGGLIVCRPGVDGDMDERYLRQMAKLVRDVTGEEPDVISHDDPDANSTIEKFRTSSKRWICAVRKISEGVDIKRLRVLVMATRPTTELLFRQLVGRVVRVQNNKKREYATVYVAKFPQLQEWAATISEEAKQGLSEDKHKEHDGASERSESSFVALRSIHENGGAISDFGDEYTEAEINAAERCKLGDAQLVDIPITKIAYLRRILGVQADPVQAPNNPLHIEKKQLRVELNKAVRRLAIRRNPDQPDFAKVWRDICKQTGAKSIDDLMDNYSIDVMRQALQLVHVWLGARDAAA